MEAIGKLLDHLGYATPLLYAAAAYGLFSWLDKEASDEAKAALAGTMKFKNYKNEQIALALVEVFDRIYSAPLLSWRSAVRSALFTIIVTAFFVIEFYRPLFAPTSFFLTVLSWNVLTDYIALFLIRSAFKRSGSRPVFGLTLGTLSGAGLVVFANLLRTAAVILLAAGSFSNVAIRGLDDLSEGVSISLTFLVAYGSPAIAVFAWLPLFALGILIARALAPFSRLVEWTQWFLKDGATHPLKAVGYIAATAVFAISAAVQFILKS